MFKALVVLFYHKAGLKLAGIPLKLNSSVAKNFPKMIPVTPHSARSLSNNVSPLSPASSPDHKETEEQKWAARGRRAGVATAPELQCRGSWRRDHSRPGGPPSLRHLLGEPLCCPGPPLQGPCCVQLRTVLPIETGLPRLTSVVSTCARQTAWSGGQEACSLTHGGGFLQRPI